jgi:hypothetical protein
MAAAYITNEDSHPHPVAAGETSRFTLELARAVGRMDVKCSLEGDSGMPLTAVTLRTRGLTDVVWPFPTRTIRVEQKSILTLPRRHNRALTVGLTLSSSTKMARERFGTNATTTDPNQGWGSLTATRKAYC